LEPLHDTPADRDQDYNEGSLAEYTRPEAAENCPGPPLHHSRPCRSTVPRVHRSFQLVAGSGILDVDTSKSLLHVQASIEMERPVDDRQLGIRP